MQGGQNEMTRQRRLHGYLGSLVIADLADQDHVRVGAQDRAQATGEGEACTSVYLDLIDTRSKIVSTGSSIVTIARWPSLSIFKAV